LTRSALRPAGEAIREALLTCAPRDKAMAARAVARDWRLGRLVPDFSAAMPDAPGRPVTPELLPPGRMAKRLRPVVVSMTSSTMPPGPGRNPGGLYSRPK